MNDGILCAVHEKLPDGHTKKHPGAILFITLHGTASVKAKQEVRLHNFKRLVAIHRNAERELLGDVGKFSMQIGLFGIKLGSDGADWK